MKTWKQPVCLLLAGAVLYTGTSLDVQASGFRAGMTAVMEELTEHTSADEAVDMIDGVLNPQTGMEESYGYTNLGVANVQNHLNIRKEPKENASLVGTMVKNSGCEVLETTDDGWAKIKSGRVEGYVSMEYLLTGEEAHARAAEAAMTMATVNTTTLKVRFEPSVESKVLTLIPIGEELVVEEELDEWIKVTVDEDEGYVSKEFVDLALELPKAATLSEVTGVSDNRSSLVAYAKQFIGNPYVWGGTSLTKGADCSGFVLSVYKKYGISLPHSSKAQANCGTRIKASAAKPGDLFFYGKNGSINHVAIYIGGGQVVHASSKKTGIKISNAYYRTPICVVSLMK